MGETMQELIRRALPEVLRADPSFRHEILEITRTVYAERDETAARFDRVLTEIQRDREEQSRRWIEAVKERERDREEQNRKWDQLAKERKQEREEQNHKWVEAAKERERDREEQNQKWSELAKKFELNREEQNRRWDQLAKERKQEREEQNRKWVAAAQERERDREEQNRKWDQQMAENRNLLKEIQNSRTRQEQAISAIGARWGIAAEHSFRAALKAILEQSFNVQVINYNDYDDSGMVFGAPEQIEIDVIIKNGEVILCELKSSLSKGDIYLFERKVNFYAQKQQRTVTRKLVISPLVRPNARAVAERLGIEVYDYAEDTALG